MMKITNLEQLLALKEQGLKLTYPEKIKIMVGMATCGISAGADKVYQALAEKLAETGVEAVLEKTGCIGFCQREPLVDVVYPGKVRLSYQGMTPAKAMELVTALKENRIYADDLLCRMDHGRNSPGRGQPTLCQSPPPCFTHRDAGLSGFAIFSEAGEDFPEKLRFYQPGTD